MWNLIPDPRHVGVRQRFGANAPAGWKPVPREKIANRSQEMQKRIVGGVEVQRGSDNVFADLGLPDAEKLKIKTGLVVEIRKATRTLGLTQQEAAKRMGVPQAKVSGMMRGDFTNLSERKLMDCLNRLGYDIEIKIRPAAEAPGRLTLAVA
jgi:predicted XRE-type DNA-binding protein